MATSHRPVWALPIEAVYPALDTTAQGLTRFDAQQRLEKFGA
jgi:hypothetical protein